MYEEKKMSVSISLYKCAFQHTKKSRLQSTIWFSKILCFHIPEHNSNKYCYLSPKLDRHHKIPVGLILAGIKYTVHIFSTSDAQTSKLKFLCSKSFNVHINKSVQGSLSSVKNAFSIKITDLSWDLHVVGTFVTELDLRLDHNE